MTSVIATLRKLAPQRPLTFIEALRVAELQANRLLELQGVTGPPVPEAVVAALPRVLVDRMMVMPGAGASDWIDGRWVIVVKGSQPLYRQRFGIFHEFKHVIDHTGIAYLYPAFGDMTSRQRAEHIAEYFAACCLMPRQWVKRDFGRGLQDPPLLALRYGVSWTAMQRRLRELGLVTAEPQQRCEYRESQAEVA